MPGIRIGRDELSFPAGVACNLRNQFGRQETFAIIFEDNGVGLGQIACEPIATTFSICAGEGPADLLAVDPNDLLMLRDDACFNDRAKRLDSINRNLEMSISCSAKNSRSCRPLRSVPSKPDHRDVIHEFAQIARDVGGAARIKRFAGHFNNRHRSLGRDAADFSPNKFVQHQIADHQDSLGRCAVEKSAEAGSDS